MSSGTRAFAGHLTSQDPLKYIRLGSDDWYLTIEAKSGVFEQVGSDNWGKQRYTNTFPRAIHCSVGIFRISARSCS